MGLAVAAKAQDKKTRAAVHPPAAKVPQPEGAIGTPAGWTLFLQRVPTGSVAPRMSRHVSGMGMHTHWLAAQAARSVEARAANSGRYIQFERTKRRGTRQEP